MCRDRAQSDLYRGLPAPSDITSPTASAARPGEGNTSSLAPPEASASPTFRAARDEPAISPVHGSNKAQGADADAMREPSENEARLEVELAAARREIAALRAAAEGRGSAFGAARRSDLLVLQELETEEMRARLAEANGCVGNALQPSVAAHRCGVCLNASYDLASAVCLTM